MRPSYEVKTSSFLMSKSPITNQFSSQYIDLKFDNYLCDYTAFVTIENAQKISKQLESRLPY